MMEIKNLKSYLLLILVLMTTSLLGQSNFFSFTYTPAITKLNIKNFPNGSGLGEWNIYYKSKENNMPVYGFNTGFYYAHIFDKFSLGLGVLYSNFAQQSGLYYQWSGLSNYSDNYGGTNYIMTYKGAEFPLFFNYIFKQKDRFSLSLELGLSYNIMLSFEIRNYIVQKKSGVYDFGGIVDIIRGTDGKFELIKYRIFHADSDLVRLGAFTGFKIDYQLHKHLSVSMMPILKYYSNTLEKAYNGTSLDADAFLLGTQLNLNLKF